MGQRGAVICEQTHLLTQLSVPAFLDMSQRGDEREEDSVRHTVHLLGWSLLGRFFGNKGLSCD